MINERRTAIETELEEVEPQLQAAKEAVGSITKSALTELKNMGKNAPLPIQLACRAAVSLMKSSKDILTWEQAGKEMKDSAFISNVKNFDPQSLSEKARNNIETLTSGKDWYKDVSGFLAGTGPRGRHRCFV